MADAPHGAEGAHGGEASGAFPPFDSTLFASQLVWFVVTFGALYFILSRYVLPAVQKVVETREGTVKGDLEAAATQGAAAEAARAAMEQAVTKARADARALVEAERLAAVASLAEDQAKAERALVERANLAEARINDTRAKALAEVDSLAADLARSVVEKVLPAKTAGGARA